MDVSNETRGKLLTTPAKKMPSLMAESYYLVIRGKKYDRRMVELADGLTSGRGDGRISINDAKNLLRVVKDSNTYSQVEKQTMEYIRRKYKFTKEGDELFRTEIRKWAASKRSAKPAKKTSGSSRKAAAPAAAPSAAATAPIATSARAAHGEPVQTGGAWKEILFALLLIVGIAALFYFIVYKSGWVKPAVVNPPATTATPAPGVDDVAKSAVTPAPAVTAKPEATVAKPVAAPEPVNPAKEPAKAAAPVSPDLGALIEKTQVKFTTDKTEITPAGIKTLDELAEKIKSEKMRIQITGHTCSRGPKSLNQEISLKRAKVVKEALVARGVDPARLEVRGVADSEPVGDNKTVAGRVANRRVNFKVIK